MFRRWPFPRGKGLLLKAVSPILRNREIVSEVAEGVLVPIKLDDWMTLHGLVEGYDREFDLSWAFIRPGDVVIDAGANIGIWTIGAAKRTGSQGKVHAFEPLEENFVRLFDNVELNGLPNVILQKFALSDRGGPRKFYPSPNNNSGVGRLMTDEWNGPQCIVQAVALDEYCEQQGIKSVQLLKIDVEGAEYFVLKGATRLLSSPNPPIVVFEMNRGMAGDLGASPQKLETLLAGLNYTVFRYSADGLSRINLAEFSGHEDLVALKAA